MEWARFCGDPAECIMLTCHPEYEFTRKALQLGCLDYLLKPVDVEDMERCLQKAVSRLSERRGGMTPRRSLAAYGSKRILFILKLFHI